MLKSNFWLKCGRKIWVRKTLGERLSLEVLAIDEIDLLYQWLDKIEGNIRSQENKAGENVNTLLRSIDRFRLILNLRKSRISTQK
jgi:hypothetical protein